MKQPTGKLAFAYQTIAKLETERDQLRAENENLRLALNEWFEKTEWVQKAISTGALPVRYLGMHRADALRAEIEALRKDAERYRWLRAAAVRDHGIAAEKFDAEFDASLEAIDAAMAAKEGE